MNCKSGNNWHCLVLFLTFMGHMTESSAVTVHESLYKKIFNGYNKNIRPLCSDENAPIPMSINMFIRQIIELNEPKQVLSLNVWLQLHWKDCRLRWSPADYNNISVIVAPFKDVWVPDLTLYDSSVDTKLGGMSHNSVKIFSDGNMSLHFPSVLSSLCSINIQKFPFDTQSCSLQFGSWAYTGNELECDKEADSLSWKEFVNSIEWDVLDSPIIHDVTWYTYENGQSVPFPTVIFTVNLKRKPLFYVLNIITPCILITFVAVFGFLLPPESGEKVNLSVTVLLSLAVFQLLILETMPASGETTPLIGIYFMISMILVGLSCLMTVLVLLAHYKGHNGAAMPRWIQRCIKFPLSRVTFIKPNTREHMRRCSVFADPRTVDPLLPNGLIEKGFKRRKQSKISIDSEQQYFPTEEERKFGVILDPLNDISNKMSLVTEYLKQQDERNIVANEWNSLSAMLDRLCMVLYLIATTIVTCMLVLPVAL